MAAAGGDAPLSSATLRIPSTNAEVANGDTQSVGEGAEELVEEPANELHRLSMNDSWYGIPCEEIDKHIFDETFCVISRKFGRDCIYRFSATKSLFLLGPLNPLRKLTIFITTHQYFDIFMILAIVTNCITLGMVTNIFDKDKPNERIIPAYDFYVDRIEYAFLGIYTFELILRVLSKGFILNKFSYLRNRWNILDLIVVVSGYVTILADVLDTTNVDKKENELEFLRTFRVLRAFKTLSILPGLRVMINALLNSMVHLLEVMALTVVCLIIFSLFALELFRAKLRQKCVVDKGGILDVNRSFHKPIEQDQVDRDRVWTEWVTDYRNWKRRDFPKSEAIMCGNGTLTRTCGPGYTCIGQLGDNPDLGWTGFDNFHSSMLSTFQLLTLDYWERLYDVVLSTCGIWSVVFFIVVIFLGSYYLLNLMLAVVAMSYENETQEQSQEETRSWSAKLRDKRDNSNFSFDALSELRVCKLTYYKKRTDSEKAILEKKARLSASSELDEEHRPIHDNNVTIGDTIFSILGMRMALEEADEERRLGSVFVMREPQQETIEHEEENADGASDGQNDNLKEFDSNSEDDRDVSFVKSAVLVWTARLSMCLKKTLKPVVEHHYFEIFIMLSIMVNTLVLAMEHHDSSKEFDDNLRMANHMFMAIFTAECIIKSMALQEEYFHHRWNIFDLLIVMISYVDLVIVHHERHGNGGLSVIRSMRLLRVFKLAQSWITMKVLLSIIFASVGALVNLSFVLLIVIYIFAVMGMQVVGGEYTPEAFDAVGRPDKFPPWHWRHFWYAFMMVFRVLCGEWIEPLWDCLQAQEKSLPKDSHNLLPYIKCFLIYLPILIVGNFIVLNLFLALLLNSFDTEELNARRERELQASGRTENMKAIVGLLMQHSDQHVDTEEAPDEVGVAAENVNAEDKKLELHDAAARMLLLGIDGSPDTARRKDSFKHTKLPETLGKSKARARFKKSVRHVIMQNRKEHAERAIARAENKWQRERHHQNFFLRNPGTKDEYEYDALGVDVTPESSVVSDITVAGECLPAVLWNSKFSPCRWICRLQNKQWEKFRGLCVLVVGHPVFEWFILILIFASSITLCFEDVTLDSKPTLKIVLCYLNFAFTGAFFVEMIFKWFALGLWNYFTSTWCLLDCFTVCVSSISMYYDITLGTCYTSAQSISADVHLDLDTLKALRALRALRPLRAISRWHGMKIVVNALVYAIPSIFNVLLVCLLFWLVFAIMGVQFFKGQFYRCLDSEGERVDPRIVPNKDVCCAKADLMNYSWVNTMSNYDNVGEGYLSLLQIATFEGWMELMQYSVDATGVDLQPVVDHQIQFYAFYVVFIIVGSFFTLQLFIGVIIDNFNMLKTKYEGNMLEVLLTPNQRSYYVAMKNLGRRKPKKIIKRPTNKVFRFFYDVSMSRKLEIAIFTVIFMDMASEEVLIKLTGLGSYYFTVGWNVFDFVVVLASLMDMFLAGDLEVALPIPPTMLRIIRVFRIGRILRLVKAAKGIRKLLFALVVSLPALFNIGALLTLITFIYAILGMALFGKAPRKWSVDDLFNFETFLNSNLMLLRLMTAAGWNEVLDSLTVVEPVCGSYRSLECGLPDEPECPNRAVVIAYLVSYLILTYLIVINLYIAIILENYVEATNEEDIGIVEDDLDMFYAHWARYDPLATQFIRFEDLPDLLDSLDEPLKIRKPNILAIVAFNFPIARGNKIHCLDILCALVRHVLGGVDDTPEFRKLQSQLERKFQRQFPTRRFLDIVSSTRRWKIEHNAALIIQRAWRTYYKRTHPPPYREISVQTGFSHELIRTHGGLGHMMTRRKGGVLANVNPEVKEKIRRRQEVGDKSHIFDSDAKSQATQANAAATN